MTLEETKVAFDMNRIPIVLACDDNYAPYLSVALTSIQRNSSEVYNYDVFVLNRNLTEGNKKRIIDQFSDVNNFSVRFLDVNEYIKNHNFQSSTLYPVEIYFRMLIPELLKMYSKAIYLDCDLVVLCDIAELWKEDIGNNFMGAVRDIGMILHYYTKGRQYIPHEYFTDNLEDISPDNYFNTGVLIMNLEKFRKELSFEVFAEKVSQKKWYYPDQDVLNILCNGQICYLDMAWNVTPENRGNRKIENIIAELPRNLAISYVESRKSPYIIHYALHEKPWRYTLLQDRKLFEYFWKYAMLSPYYREIATEKMKTCSLAEMKYIIEKYTHDSVYSITDGTEIYYVTQSSYLGKFSDIAVKCELAELSNEGLTIEGYTTLSGKKEIDNINFYLDVNGKRFICQKYKRNISEAFDEENKSEAVSFRGYIPFDDSPMYTIRFVCELDNIYVVKKRINYGQYFPIDKRYQNQYYVKNGYKLSLYDNKLVVAKCGLRNWLASEIKYLWSLSLSKDKRNKKAVIARIVYWLSRIIPHKPIWLIGDNFLGEDNGMAFFNYLYGNKKSIIPFFVTSQNSIAFQKMQNRKNVICFESRKYKMLFLLSSISISSIIDRNLIKPFEMDNDAYRDIIHKRKFVFLQHGVITQNLAREHNKYCYNPKGFVVSAIPEYESLLNGQYFYNKKEVWLTGLPRFDLLYNDEKKYITIMPTWRSYLVRNGLSGEKEPISSFKNSAYFLFYNELLHNEKLHDAAEKYGYKICYKPHPLMKNCTQYFLAVNDEKITLLQENYRDVFAHSNLIISDYSSAIFDFLYLRKPIIYSHFDRSEFFSGKHCYDKGYLDYERDGFGEVEYTLEDTVNRIIEYMKNGCQLKDKYRQRIDNFFMFNDRNNCQRVYEKIMELDANS